MAMLAAQVVAAAFFGHGEQLGRLAYLVRQHWVRLAIGKSRREQRLELIDASADPVPPVHLRQPSARANSLRSNAADMLAIYRRSIANAFGGRKLHFLLPLAIP